MRWASDSSGVRGLLFSWSVFECNTFKVSRRGDEGISLCSRRWLVGLLETIQHARCCVLACEGRSLTEPAFTHVFIGELSLRGFAVVFGEGGESSAVELLMRRLYVGVACVSGRSEVGSLLIRSVAWAGVPLWLPVDLSVEYAVCSTGVFRYVGVLH
jgi:hypothetical protein